MRYFYYFKEYKFVLFQIFILTVLSIIVSLLLIPLSKSLTDIFLSKSLKPLIDIALLVILIYFLKGIFFFFHNFITSNLAIKITNNLRLKLYKLIIFNNYEKIKNENIGNILNTISDDILKIRELIISLFIELLPSLLMITCTLIYIFYLNWKLSILIFLLISVISFSINYFSNKIKYFSKETQNLNSDIINYINEDIHNFYIIKNLGIENCRYSNIESKQNEYNKNLLNSFKYIYLQPSLIGVFQVIGISIITVFSTYQMILGKISISELISFGTAISLTIEPAIFITNSIAKISKNIISFERIIDLIESFKIDNSIDKIYKLDKYDISIKLLSYFINNKEIINNINLDIKEGNSILIKGNNGVGKSTLVSIIAGIYKNYNGNVKIDKYELRNNYIEDIKISSHEAFIFSGTIKDNILLGNIDLSDNELEIICKLLEIEDYNKFVGIFGNNLSSGQKQRISIARAISCKPKILILDEALSAIDIESEIRIYNNIRNYLDKSTIIIISHRKVDFNFIDFEFEL